MRDESFIRGDVPMTKSEVRAVSVSKLELTGDSVLYDIGAGTGSVSVEASFMIPDGKVYAVEKDPEALRLIIENKDRFRAENISVIEGEAPDAFKDLPVPTHAFIGGSGGKLDEIIEELFKKNPDIRIVINVITLESLSNVLDIIKRSGRDAEIVMLQVSRSKVMGSDSFHLMQGLNPVYVISFGGDHQKSGDMIL